MTTHTMPPYAILFVCTGNICRSPTAEAVLRHKIRAQGWEAQVQVESASTHDYHTGEPPDIRSQKHAMRRGYDMSALRARVFEDDDYARFDLILAMDETHMRVLQSRCPPQYPSRLHYFTAFCCLTGARDVPDPYYGDAADFEQVLDRVEDGCDGLVAHLRARTG